MKIGIDARFYKSETGIGRYVEELVKNLKKIDPVNQYFIFLKKQDFDNFQETENFKKVLTDVKWYGWQEQVEMPKLLKKYNLDLAHFPNFNVPIFYRGDFVVTIHDLILFKHPSIRATTLGPIKYFFKWLAYKIIINSGIKKAKNILAVSRATKDDILKNFKVNPDKIIVTHLGVAEELKTGANIDLKEKFKISQPFLLYAGNAYPHKNLKILLEVIKELPDYQLVLVGKEDDFYRELKKAVEKHGLSEKIIFTGWQLDNVLAQLCQQARLYIFPSLAECFGMPPLEAMKQGTPAAVSDLPVLREILGEAALYFDPNDKNGIIKIINQLCTDDRLRQQQVNLGYQQIKKYNWDKTAEKTFEIYEKIKKTKQQKENFKKSKED